MPGRKLIVIGGGAAGFFCAVNAARLDPQLDVLVLERSSKLLSKVKVSGGGRCNVTHACYSITDMCKSYPRGSSFLKKAFHHFFTKDTISWFEQRNVKLKAEADGRMFPVSDRSQTIVDCLLDEAARFHVKIQLNVQVDSISKNGDEWTVCAGNKRFNAHRICIAAGGFNKAEQFNWITSTGHSIQNPVPSLFTFNCPGDDITRLMGISVNRATVKLAGTKLQESGPLLITHWGLSGPTVLKLSAWGARELASRHYTCTVIVNWLPEFNENTLREKCMNWRFELASRKMINHNPAGLPSRLWEYLLITAQIDPGIRWADLPVKEQNRLVKLVCAQEFQVKGKTTFKEEFVTAGGVSLDEIDVNSMQSKIIPGLFFAGEVMDVDGITGGFNFQHAWTSGWIAARGIAESLK